MRRNNDMKRRVLPIAVAAVLLLLTGCFNPTGSSGGETGGGDDDSGSTEDYTSPNIGTLVYVPAGSFQRYAIATDISTVSRPFRMSEHEITRSQFSAIMGTDPSNTAVSAGTDDPVQSVSWYDAIAFANKLSIEEGLTPVYSVTVGGTPIDWEALSYDNTGTDDIPDADDDDWNAATADWDADGYRLPTEMEWMWAAMGADQDAQPGAMQDGVNVSGFYKDFAGYDGSNTIDDYAWYSANSSSTTHPVGTKLPNELGLYDMSGNVWEWNWDWEVAYPSGELTDYRGPASGSRRMRPGGSWDNSALFSPLNLRAYNDPHFRSYYNGFRLVRP